MEELIGAIFTPVTILQGGPVLISLVLLAILFKFTTNHTVHTDAIIEKNTIAHTLSAERSEQQTRATEVHTVAINKLIETLDRKL